MWQNMAMTQKNDRVEVIRCGLLTSRKPLGKGQLLLCLHDAVLIARERDALQPLALGVASAQVLRTVGHLRVFTAQSISSGFQQRI